jgi:hypothetical protein
MPRGYSSDDAATSGDVNLIGGARRKALAPAPAAGPTAGPQVTGRGSPPAAAGRVATVFSPSERVRLPLLARRKSPEARRDAGILDV